MCLLVPCCSGCQQPGPGRGGQEGTALAAAVPGQVLLLGVRAAPERARAVPSPTLKMPGKDARPALLSSQRRRRRDKCKNHPTALPAHCTHTANASMLFYPGLPMAPCVNTASTHTRAKSGSSARKTHIWESTADFHAFILCKVGFIKAGRVTPSVRGALLPSG